MGMKMIGKGIEISNLISLLCPVERSHIKALTQKASGALPEEQGIQDRTPSAMWTQER